MIKMIVADDDRLTVDTLCEAIDWPGYGIEVIATAMDGDQTLKLCRELEPDILFTDIKMPGMTGLEVATTLREEGNAAKIILISGVQDFQYARTALEVKVEGYILKPIQLEEIHRVIRKLLSNLEMERNRDQVMLRLKRQLKENRSMMRETFLRNLVLGACGSRREIEDKLQYFELDLRYESSVLTCVMRINDYTKYTQQMSELDKQLLLFSIANITQELLGNNNAGLVVVLNDNEFVLLLDGRLHRTQALEDLLGEITDNMLSFLDIPVSIGVGNCAFHLGELKYAYDNAVRAISQRFYQEDSAILSVEDVLLRKEKDKIEYSSKFSQIYNAQESYLAQVKNGEEAASLRALGSLFALMSQGHMLEIEYVKGLCIELAGVLCRMLLELEDTGRESFVHAQEDMKSIFEAETIAAMENILAAMSGRYCKTYQALYLTRYGNLVKTIIDMIDKRYMEDLTLSAIADAVYMTQNYICLIFKRETGMTINAYLTRVRLQKACRLLDESKLKVWQIAEQVGYENAHYFSTVFKKAMGVQPQQYRSRREEQN